MRFTSASLVSLSRLSLVAAAAALFAGCGDSTGPVTLGGSWSFTDAISNNQLATSCQSSASIDLTQNGNTFNGSVATGSSTCSSGTSSNTSAIDGSLFGAGQISGTSISFTDDGGCTYNGTVSGNPVNRMSGDESCVVALSGTNYTFTGNWQASR
jgi:hypothetical protein